MHALLLLSSLLTASPTTLHVTIDGPVESSLDELSPHAASVLAAQVARLIRWRGDITRDLHRGDRLSLVYEPGEAPELLGVHYRGAQIELSAYRFVGEDGIPRFWDEAGRLIEPTLGRSPVAAYVQITETVQRGRGKRRHEGIDFKAAEGTPVTLPFGGVVTRVNWSRRVNGNCVEVRTDSGRLLRFLHLAHVETSVRRGTTLAAGAAIGSVGNTGRSSAPHLHYEVRAPSGAALDPLEIHGTGSARLQGDSLDAFHGTRRRLGRMLDDRTTASVRQR